VSFSKAVYNALGGLNEPTGANFYNKTALLERNIAPLSAFSHTKEAFFEIGGWDTTLLEAYEWDYWARLFIRYGPPAFIDSVTTSINRAWPNEIESSKIRSWEQVVGARIKHMSFQYRHKVEEKDLAKFHVPKLTVLMPVYNAEKYLLSALKSISAQTFHDFEVLAIDDGSTDSSKAILEQYAESDERFKIVSMPRSSGVTKTLNHGLVMSRTEYVARMDADDISLPDRFKKQVDFLDSNPDVMLCGGAFLSMNTDMTQVIWTNNVETEPADIKKTLLDRCCIGHPTVMMRRSLIENIGLYSEDQDCLAVEDYELWLRASVKFKLANLPNILLHYRGHDEQVGKKLSTVQKDNFELIRQKYRLLANAT